MRVELRKDRAGKARVYIVSLNIAPFVPYVHGLLRSFAEQDDKVMVGYEFGEPFFHMTTPSQVVDQLDAPSVVGLSCYIWNMRKHMKIARLVKERYPDAVTVAGGPQVPDVVGTFFEDNPQIDVLVHGEGEIAFQRLLSVLLDDEPDLSQVPGISFVRSGKVVTTPRAPLDMAALTSSPYLQGHLDGAIARLRADSMYFFVPWETNRGCPYSCSFCDWGSSTMSKVRQFAMERLLEEIDFFGRSQVPVVHINDANFGLLVRDVDIARAMVDARVRYGYPHEMRLNFAKNSNSRVFEISRNWNQGGLLSKTTMSMQATTPKVLEAIQRKNIPVEQYRNLQEQYRNAGIDTYTEVILGLPEETAESFRMGLDYVLEMGNHDDIRVYELVVLPNAPIADPATMRKYGLAVIDKELPMGRPGSVDPVECDEIEYLPTVIETSTMSREEWVECSCYVRMLHVLHSCHLTRYLAIHLRRRYGVRYHEFYRGLQLYAQHRPASVLGSTYAAFTDFYQRYQQGPELPTLDRSFCPPEMDAYLAIRPWFPNTDIAWVALVLQWELFGDELRDFLGTLEVPWGEELSDVVRYQLDLVVRPDYDPKVGRRYQYDYDLPQYFTSTVGDLIRRPTTVRYRDCAMGSSQNPLRPGDHAAYLAAVLSVGMSGTQGHYRHQEACAEVTYP